MKTIVHKICESIKTATGICPVYQSPAMINELLDDVEFPVAYVFLLDNGQLDTTGEQYRERITISVFFTDLTEYDFLSFENEEIIQRCKEIAYKWLHSLRDSADIRLISINNTQRLYDTNDVIVTGFAVNVTIEEMTGWTGC